MDDLNYDELGPRIRNCVRWLRENGWNTTDSGDGSKAETMECAMDVPMVAIRLDDGDDLCWSTNELYSALWAHLEAHGRKLVTGAEGFRVEGSYSPGEPAIILLTGDALLDWFS